MDAIGKAIRAALAKGNAGDPSHRERVYHSAQSALENALDKEGVTDAAARQARRQRLLQTISEIERDYLPAPAPAPMSAPASAAPPRPTADEAVRADPPFDSSADSAPEVRVERQKHDPGPGGAGLPPRVEPSSGRAEPSFGEPASEHSQFDASDGMAPIAADGPVAGPTRRRGGKKSRRKADGRPRRRPFAWAMLVLTLIVFGLLGVGFWKLSNADYEFVLEQFLQEVEPGDDYTPEARLGSNEDDRSQIALYDPVSGSQPETTGNLSTELVETGQSRVLHIEGGGSEDTAVVIAVPRQALADLAGLPYTIAIRARAEAEQSTPVMISCDFAGLGDCGTRRYQVQQTAGDLLFAGTMGDGAATGAGSIRIALPESGSEIEIFSVTLLVGDG